jgi:hypothetical protein
MLNGGISIGGKRAGCRRDEREHPYEWLAASPDNDLLAGQGAIDQDVELSASRGEVDDGHSWLSGQSIQQDRRFTVMKAEEV